MRTTLLPLLACAVMALPRSASSAPQGVVMVPAGGGQAAIAARATAHGISYRACTQGPCAPDERDPAVLLPPGIAGEGLTLDALSLGQARHALFAHGPTFAALLAAAPGSEEVRVLFAGPVGYSRGDDGERHGDWVEVTEPEPDATVRVLVGEVREDVTLCGRRTLLSPKVLDPKDLSFNPARFQRLTPSERARATALQAVPLPAAPAMGVGRILRGAAASSAIGSPAALTDGDLETTWSEARGADGAGEFVQLNAPEQVPITSLSIVARPRSADLPKGAGPKKLWLATPDALYAVTFDEDPWALPGAAFELKFPAPLRTSCLAFALDEAYSRGRPNVDVTLAEVTAHTELDQASDAMALAGALAGGGDRARAAAAILTRGGDPAFQAVMRAYPDLDDGGRVLALEIIDGAPCADSARVYVEALAVGKPGEVHHAVTRLARCGRAAAPALVRGLSSPARGGWARITSLLSLVAPDVAVDELVPLLASARAEQRVTLRAAIAAASRSPAGLAAASTQLRDARLADIAAIDLLRAATSSGQVPPSAGDAFARLTTPAAEFRTRYLLLAPAAELAARGDPGAARYLVGAIVGDADPHVRARAAELAASLPRARDGLTKALTDGDPRVRDSAVVSLARQLDPGSAKVQREPWPARLAPAMLALFAEDPFTFVRVHAAETLVFAPAGDEIDAPLARGMEDGSALVRARAIEALGRRGASRYAADIRDRLEDEQEAIEVRARAARALGRMCDARSADALTELANRAALAGANADALGIAEAAAAALGRISPPDLVKRLAPLTGEGAPPLARAIARASLGAAERCIQRVGPGPG